MPTTDETAEYEIVKDRQIKGGSENILFVDDEKALCDIAKTQLESLGYAVEATTSSVEALKVFKTNQNKYDLIITDMTMPEMTGDQLAAKILGIRSDIPIILCSGYNSRVDAESAKERGIKAYLAKPISKQKMAEAIRQVLD